MNNTRTNLLYREKRKLFQKEKKMATFLCNNTPPQPHHHRYNIEWKTIFLIFRK